MMMRASRFLTAAGLATSCAVLVGSSFDAAAQTSVDRAFDASPRGCSDVRWSRAALEAFPQIASACQAVEERNGKSYVKFEGTVEEVDDGGKRVRVDFEDGNTLTFTPTPNTGLYIEGERQPFSALEAGQELNFYIPEDRLHAELQPDPDRLAFIIVPLDLDVTTIGAREQRQAADRASAQSERVSQNSELPNTASALPWLAASGLGAVLFGLAMTLRRLFSRR